MVTLHTVILSKDRPAQLDLLLRSIKKHVIGWPDHAITVLYRTTHQAYAKGYETVRAEHPELAYLEEESFRRDFQMIALRRQEEYFQVLVDDDCYVRPWSMSDPEFKHFSTDDQVVALVLRMAPYMDYCYPLHLRVPPPKFDERRAWAWKDLVGDFGYPHSIDATVWRTSTIRGVLAYGPYRNVHELEPALSIAMTKPLAICYGKPRVLNVANNTVQDTATPNRHGGGDAAAMNERFLGGERIVADNIESATPSSPHFQIDFQWGLA